MPRLLGPEALGELPSGRSGKPIASYDTSAAAEGVAKFGGEVQQTTAELKANWEKLRGLAFEQKYQEFVAAEEKGFDEATRAMQPGQAVDFANRYATGYKERVAQFTEDNGYDALDPVSKQQYETRLFSTGQELYRAGAKVEREEQTRFASNTIRDTINGTLLPKARAAAGLPPDDPRKAQLLTEAEGTAVYLIDANPHLTAIQKDELKREARGNIQTGFAEGLSPTEKQGLLAGGAAVAEAPEEYRSLFQAAGELYGIDPNLLAAVAKQESAFDPDVISGKRLSPKGAGGIMQLMPDTAKQYGADALKPTEAIDAGAKHLRYLLDKYGGDQTRALAAYNWGEGNLDKWLKAGGDPAKMPAETRDYVKKIMGASPVDRIALNSLPYDKRIAFAKQGDAEIAAAEAEQARIEREGRPEVARTAIDLMLDNKMTPEWLSAHRDDLTAPQYEAARKSMLPDDGRVKTDPREYLHLLDLVQSDPREAEVQARDMYAAGEIDRDTFSTIVSKARTEPPARPESKQVRSYVDDVLHPPPDASQREWSNHLDLMTVFDDWSRANPKADRNQIRAFADDLVTHQKQYLGVAKRGRLPLPAFVQTPREAVGVLDLQKARAWLQIALQNKTMTEDQVATEAATLKQWFDTFGEAAAANE